MQATQSIKCNEMYKWKDDMKHLSWYLHKANVDHTINGQGTAVSTLDYSATST